MRNEAICDNVPASMSVNFFAIPAMAFCDTEGGNSSNSYRWHTDHLARQQAATEMQQCPVLLALTINVKR